MAALRTAGTGVVLIVAAAAQSWVAQTSGTNASLRGLKVVDEHVVWASGTSGTYLRTVNGGGVWVAAQVPGADKLDFRDVHALDEHTAWLMSSGTGDLSRIYKTTDGGTHWQLVLANPEPKGFFDGMDFQNARRGMLVGDPVDGQMFIMTTEDGGDHWERRSTPPAIPGEGAFAASGTSVVMGLGNEAWFATGGPGAARVYHTGDFGRTWTVTAAPVRNDGPAAGIFSLGFSDPLHGMAVGGDYTKADATERNIAITSDGGRTWSVPAGAPPKGFRSAVAFAPDRKLWVAVGTSGSDISEDGGQSWRNFDTGAFNAAAFVSSNAGWAVGPRGRIGKFQMH